MVFKVIANGGLHFFITSVIVSIEQIEQIEQNLCANGSRACLGKRWSRIDPKEEKTHKKEKLHA